MAEEDLEGGVSLLIDSGSVLLFKKSGTVVKVSDTGVIPEDAGDMAIRKEASEIFETAGHWIGIHVPLSEAGFEWLGVELFEDMALEFLDDAYTEAAEADGHLRRADEVDDPGSQIGHRLAAVPHIRKAIILAAASGEAYINEFIARRLPDRVKALDRNPDECEVVRRSRAGHGKAS